MEKKKLSPEFKKWVHNLSNTEFYDECVNCRSISYGSVDGDDPDYFYSLVDAYAENKYADLLQKMKCCENCKHCRYTPIGDDIVNYCEHESSCHDDRSYYYWELKND